MGDLSTAPFCVLDAIQPRSESPLSAVIKASRGGIQSSSSPARPGTPAVPSRWIWLASISAPFSPMQVVAGSVLLHIEPSLSDARTSIRIGAPGQKLGCAGPEGAGGLGPLAAPS